MSDNTGWYLADPTPPPKSRPSPPSPPPTAFFGSMDEPRQADTVNAYHDDKRGVIIAFRIEGEWQTFRLTYDEADQLQGMLYLLVDRG